MELIDRQAFIERERKLYCEDCDRRKGMKNGKLTVCYEIGEAPCRSCWLDDALTDLEDAPTIDAVPMRHGEWVWKHRHHGGFKTAKGKCECGRDVYAQIDERYESDDPYCPFCGVMNDSIFLNYCPNCRARMDGERREG